MSEDVDEIVFCWVWAGSKTYPANKYMFKFKTESSKFEYSVATSIDDIVMSLLLILNAFSTAISFIPEIFSKYHLHGNVLRIVSKLTL